MKQDDVKKIAYWFNTDLTIGKPSSCHVKAETRMVRLSSLFLPVVIITATLETYLDNMKSSTRNMMFRGLMDFCAEDDGMDSFKV